MNLQKKYIVGLYGASGFGREVMPLLLSSVRIKAKQAFWQDCKIYFIDDARLNRQINGYDVISFSDFISLECQGRYFNVAVADSRLRESIASKCIAHNVLPHTITSSQSVQHDANEIGIGAIICDQTIITSNVLIGKFFHLNIFSYVAHDCVIGDYVTFAPNVHCNGNVHIGDHAYIGTGAIIKQGTPDKPLIIGEGAVVGMGAVVTKDVSPGMIVIGNPARTLSSK